MESSNNLKKFRNASGFTQERLAKESGISIRTIQRIEKGLSPGSSYTLKTLATALKIDNWSLLLEENSTRSKHTNLNFNVKLMNLSSLAVIVFPLSNIIFPLLIFLKQENRSNHHARKILGFQFLWLMVTMILMIVVPMVLILAIEPLRGSGIPLYVLVYLLSVMVNVYFVLKTAIEINKQKDILSFVPAIF